MVTICLLGTPENFKGAAQKNWQIIKNIGLPVLFTPSIEEINSSIKTNDLIVDAIFGTGLNRAITGYYYQVIHLINSKNNPVFSIDIPVSYTHLYIPVMNTSMGNRDTLIKAQKRTGRRNT